MKILVLNHNLKERGTYFRALWIAKGLHARGHDVTFATTGWGYWRARKHSPRPRWQMWQTANWQFGLSPDAGYSPIGLLQRAVFLRGRWDLIYSFSHKPVDQGAARLLRGKTAFWMTDWCDLWSATHGGSQDIRFWTQPLPSRAKGLRGGALRAWFRLDTVLEESAVRDADAVSIIASPMWQHTRRLGIPDERVLHLPSGADTARIKPIDRARAREQLGLPHDRPIVAYVANYTPDNGLLAEALKEVWQCCPEALFLSVGPTWFERGSVVDEAVQEGRAVDLERRPFKEIPVVLAAADVMTMPLRDTMFNRSRWPNKFGDHMAAGRATATCRVGDMGAVIDRYEVGTAGPPTPAGLAQAILELLRNPEKRDECERNALGAAKDQYSWKRQIHTLCEYLKGRGLDL